MKGIHAANANEKAISCGTGGVPGREEKTTRVNTKNKANPSSVGNKKKGKLAMEKSQWGGGRPTGRLPIIKHRVVLLVKNQGLVYLMVR